MTASAQSILNDVFGYHSFRGDQEAAIAAALGGHDSLVLQPTGGGKSVCYQIPAILMDGVTLVVSPLIALMQDQVAALRQLGIDAAFLNSTLSGEEQSAIYRRLATGEIKLLYVAPERLMQARTIQRLQAVNVGLIAIDEAHCVSQWGHDFRVDYLSLGDLIAPIFVIRCKARLTLSGNCSGFLRTVEVMLASCIACPVRRQSRRQSG